jgi:anaphase-promoting complex subunit 2
MLVNIYGNKDMFVEEYTTLLADRLLAATGMDFCLIVFVRSLKIHFPTDFNTDKEVRNVELLKLKFGDASLQNCEIMLRDLADSKRVNNFVKGQLAASKAKADEDEENRLTESEVPFGATLLSHLFWPGPLKSEPVGLPAVIQKFATMSCSKCFVSQFFL